MQKELKSQNEFEQCVKCTVCTAYCPMVAVRPSYPGPKAAGPDMERYRLKSEDYFEETLKYCLNCKRCEVACPSGVKVADIIQKARIEYSDAPVKLRDWILANTDFMGSLASPFAPVVNAVTSLKPVKAVMDGVLKIDHRRTFPKYSGQKFETWFRKYRQKSDLQKVVNYFHGCFVQYNNPQLGKDFVKVCNALGYKVNLLDKEKCCGVALVANGMSPKAVKNGRHNIAAIEKASNDGAVKTVATSSSCTNMIRNEYGSLLGLDTTKVKDVMELATKFVYNEIVNNGVKLKFREGHIQNVAYHTPCHLESMGWQVYSIELLKLIPNLKLTVLDSNCCGISGTYGFKKENYEYSQQIGNPLFQQIRKIEPDYVACDCETCKWQIEMSTGFTVKHPISILAEALEEK